jgi:hypothetical protein
MRSLPRRQRRLRAKPLRRVFPSKDFDQPLGRCSGSRETFSEAGVLPGGGLPAVKMERSAFSASSHLPPKPRRVPRSFEAFVKSEASSRPRGRDVRGCGPERIARWRSPAHGSRRRRWPSSEGVGQDLRRLLALLRVRRRALPDQPAPSALLLLPTALTSMARGQWRPRRRLRAAAVVRAGARWSKHRELSAPEKLALRRTPSDEKSSVCAL